MPVSEQSVASSWRYALWSGVCTLLSACAFYTEMLAKTAGEWSAPLDDVFIHFDFARSMALGFVGQWVPGNGYSSGATSMLYPAVLAPAYALGFRGPTLMAWAAWVACMCVFYTMLNLDAAWREFAATPMRPAARFAQQALLPVALLMVGGVCWSFWSGMEVALFVALWSRSALAWVRARNTGRLGALSALCALCVMTRPEAVTTVALFALTATPHSGSIRAWATRTARVAAPAASIVLLQSALNRALTGETSAYGALVKLAVHSPQMSVAQKVADYIFNLQYAFQRPFEHHFADSPLASAVLVGLAVSALFAGPMAIFARQLGMQIVAWCVLVAFNGQVRWQNERYLVPAMVMLLLLAVLGAAQLAAIPVGRRRVPLLARELGLAAALLFVGVHQLGKWSEQKWFFGQASQNIRDQQTQLGRWLGAAARSPESAGLTHAPRRVLLSDAGAIPYASGLPALDIMGLGGFHKVPFARASGNELPAVLELIQGLAPNERPDVLAIFPSWWPTLPVWFSSATLKRFPLSHNVICGDFEHVVYAADWSLLDTGREPFARPSQRSSVVDTLDIADISSERAHHYAVASPASGKTVMHVLPDPTSQRDVWDAGRPSPAGPHARFQLRGQSDTEATLVLRVATPTAATLSLRCNGGGAETHHVDASATWSEVPWVLPASRDGVETCEIWSTDGPFESFQAFLFQ